MSSPGGFSPPSAPPCNAGLKLMHTFKKIAYNQTSKVNYILFNRLATKSSSAKQKRPSTGKSYLKFLNRCFSKVQTWPVFAEMITSVLSEENRDCLHKKCVCVRARACTCTCECVCADVCMCVCVCMCECTHVCKINN